MSLARQPDGARLLAFLRPEDGPPPNVPLTGALAIIRRNSGGRFDPNGRVLLVFTRDRKKWELPGGTIEPGESPEDCARRETIEESGQSVGPLALRGWAVWFAPEMGTGRSECCAVHSGVVDREAPFAPTDEIEMIAWRAPGEAPGPLGAIDRKLIELADAADQSGSAASVVEGG